jgi:hypothetical protein
MRSRYASAVSISGFAVLLTLTPCANAQMFSQQPFSAQGYSQQSLSHRIDLPGDAPVALVGDEWGGSAVNLRGGAYQLDVRVSLSLRNASRRRIHAITLTVVAQEAAPGGKGSISVPSLDVAPGEIFTVRGDLHLLRPAIAGSAPMVEVGLDGILFDDLTFYGPDKLRSRRAMLVWELEARRDRQYLRAVLDQSGRQGLQSELLDISVRNDDRPQYNVQSVRGRSTNVETDREVKFALLNLPTSPLEPMSGAAYVSGNETYSPKLVVRNRTSRPIRYFELGWIIRDQQGRDFMAASVPSEMRLLPRSSAQILPDAALRFDPRTSADSMTAYISQVEFADGTLWIPSRDELKDPTLRKVLAPSPEEQRLLQIYRRKGVNAVIEDLKRDDIKRDEQKRDDSKK